MEARVEEARERSRAVAFSSSSSRRPQLPRGEHEPFVLVAVSRLILDVARGRSCKFEKGSVESCKFTPMRSVFVTTSQKCP